MTVGVDTISDPYYGYGSGSSAASYNYSGNPASANVDLETLAFTGQYEAMMEGYEAQRDSVFGNLTTDVPVSTPTMDAASAYRQMREIQSEQMDYNLKQAEQFRLNQAEAMAKDNSMAFAAQNLQMKIVANEQDQILSAFNAFKTAYKNACDPEGKMDEQTLKANACAKYQELTGSNLLLDIKNNGSGSFMNSFISKITFGFFGQNQNADETIEQITGQEVSESSKKSKTTGKVLGTLTAAGTGAAIGAIWGPVGAAIGGAIGLIGSFFG